LLLSAESVSIIPNGTYQINDSAKPINASNKTLSYKSNDESIAIVNELGIITGIKAGETSITVITTDGSNISKEVVVIVRQQVESVTLNISNVEIKVGESINIIPTITPTTAAIKTLKWESSDTSIAIVENGIIGGLGVGNTTITATTQDGTNTTKTINVKVNEADPNLNFEIIGSITQPTNPVENTIWINTDTEIGEYQFGSTEPTTRSDETNLQFGDIWICTNIYAGTTFNALNKNGLQVNLSYVKQYINGSWIEKEFKLYVDGKWKDIDLVIFDGTKVKSGYSFSRVASSGSYVSDAVFNDGYLTTSGAVTYGGMALNEPIDVTNKTTIEVTVQWTASGSGVTWKDVMLKTSLTNNGTLGENRIVSTRATANTNIQTIKLDVTNLSGEYYFVIAHYHESGTAQERIYSLKVY